MFYLLEGAREGILSHFVRQKGVQEGVLGHPWIAYFFRASRRNRLKPLAQSEIKKIKISYMSSYVSKMCYCVLVHLAWGRARMMRAPLSKYGKNVELHQGHFKAT